MKQIVAGLSYIPTNKEEWLKQLTKLIQLPKNKDKTSQELLDWLLPEPVQPGRVVERSELLDIIKQIKGEK